MVKIMKHILHLCALEDILNLAQKAIATSNLDAADKEFTNMEISELLQKCAEFRKSKHDCYNLKIESM
jgi:hypothetical protein